MTFLDPPIGPDMAPKQLVVMGMHRSGTSGVTRLLNLCGAWFGPDDIATEANEENPKGFWERRDVRAVCDGLLQGSGFDWWKIVGFTPDVLPADVVASERAAFATILEELEAHRPWVVKEPRLCLLLPVLLPLLDAPVAVHVTREPLEVAQSMHARGDMGVQPALALWEAYTLSSYASTVGMPRVHVRHEDVMADPVAATQRMIEDLESVGVTGLEVPNDEVILDFISPRLHRQHRRAEDRGLRLNRAQELLGRAADDGSVLGWTDFPSLSEGAVEQLVMLEETKARAEEAELRDRQLAQQTEQLARLTERIEWWEGRVDRLAEIATEALDRTETGVRSVERSNTWKLTNRLQSIRTALTPGVTTSTHSAIDRITADIDRGRREIRGVAAVRPDGHQSSGAMLRLPNGGLTESPAVERSGPARRRTDRPRVAVIAWDVGHNPIGRANVLAEIAARRFDVEIWGARFDRYGTDVWAPLRHGSMAVNHFAGLTFPGHLAQMEAISERIDADAIWVSKPRLPSYLLGALAKEYRNRPLILDVDDHELAFFDEDEGLDIEQLRSGGPDLDLTLPFERAWTRACDPLIGSADAITVSNPALQNRYGGLIVPHARDETTFDPDRYDRDATRAQLGVAPDTRLLLFGGTPRVHKGVVEVLSALDAIGDDRYRLLVFGTRELEELRPQIGPLERWAVAVPYQPFSELARIVGAADLSCVLQDPNHPVARYQMPAKISDALAMGVPCLVTPVPPLQHLIDQGVLGTVAPGETLAQAIAAVFDDPGPARARADKGRALFLRDLSYAAVAESVAPLFEGLLEAPPAPDPGLEQLIDVPRSLFGATTVQAATKANAPSRYPRRLPGHGHNPVTGDAPFDVVMFWKQNDSDIYGRRQDMFLAELARSDRVATIVHFDNPVSPEELAVTLRRSARSRSDQGRLVVRNTITRVLHRRDTERVHRHTYLFGGRRSHRLGLGTRDGYVAYVKSVLAERGIGQRPLVVWSYPSNPDLPELIDAIAPDLVVSDVIDDNRTWHALGSPQHDRITRNYAEVLGRSDLVIANCEPVAAAMRSFAPDVHVIPNGCEPPRQGPLPPKPRALRALRGPVLGYVGNLSSRIDLDLLEELARRRPDWNLVLIGSAHLDGSALRLGELSNVHLLGVKTHDVAKDHIAHFDVGLIPHIDNEMTRSMNPLKAFVYCSAGIPVVSTPVANLDELADLITVAEGVDGFEAAIEAQLAAGRPTTDASLLEPLTWGRRVADVLALIDDL